MKTLHWNMRHNDKQVNRSVLIFGLGLIGQSIVNSLTKEIIPEEFTFPYSWKPDENQHADIIRIKKHVEIYTSSRSAHSNEIDIVWSAGIAGFGEPTEAFLAEQIAFEAVLILARDFHSASLFSKIRFHFFSSAGGLFEGQQSVDESSIANPMRPYGLAKIIQETHLLELPNSIVTCTYRPSSVYGYAGIRGRIGLIVAALKSVVENTTARIFAQPDTLRDYVYVADIGHFLKLKVLNPPTSSQTYLLASGKPTSTTELITIIETEMEKRLSVRFELSADNTLSNSYRASAVPDDWFPTSLRTGVALTAMQIVNSLILR